MSETKIVQARVEWEVWQDGECVAASDAHSDAMHYAAMYGQDGPVEVFEVHRHRIFASGNQTPTVSEAVETETRKRDVKLPIWGPHGAMWPDV